MLEVRFLGRFDLRLDNHPIQIPSHPAQSLIAYLILNANQPQRREKLAGLMWPEVTDSNSRGNLRHALWRIRKAFGSAKDTYIHSDDQAITFQLQPGDWLDIRALESPWEISASQEELEKIAQLGKDLLPGFYDEWVNLERIRYQAIFERKMGILIKSLVAARRWTEILEWAERWISFGQTPEPAFRALMLAHMNLGDASSAAAVFQRCVDQLREAMDVQPSKQTRDLYTMVQDGGIENLVELQADDAQSSDEIQLEMPQTEPQHNLPLQISSLVGREQDIYKVALLLKENRLVTLTGPGGSGKTRLALAVATELMGEFRGGIWLVELAPLDDAGLLPQAIASALNLQEVPDSPITETLKSFLRTKQLLLILDSCEHLIDKCARIAHTLLVTSPGLKILATSREPLNISGESTWPVLNLDTPDPKNLPKIEALSQIDAVKLFIARTKRILPGFTLTEQNALPVAQVCYRLSGIPLAIELAAARMQILSIERIASRLDDAFHLLVGRDRLTQPRHQAMQATIEWSHNLLSPEEKQLFRRLSIFRGGFSLEAIENICAHGDDERLKMLDLLTGLVEKSLVAVQRTADQEPRYHLLEIIQQFGQLLLHQSGEIQEIRDRHLQWYAKLAAQFDHHFNTRDQLIWIARINSEYENLRFAMNWSIETSKEAGIELSSALVYFWYSRGSLSEGVSWLNATIANCPNPPVYTRARALYGIGYLSAFLGNLDQADKYLHEGYALYQSLEDKHGMAISLFMIALITSDRGDFQEAHLTLGVAYALFEELEDSRGMARCLHLRAEDERDRGNFTLAAELSEKSLRMARDQDNQASVCLELSTLGEIYLYQHKIDQSLQLLDEALEIANAMNHKKYQGTTYFILGKAAIEQENHELARSHLLRTLSIIRDVGDKWTILLCLESFGTVSKALGQLATAARILGCVAELRKNFGIPPKESDQELYEKHLVEIRKRLGEDAFAAAWTSGQMLSLEQVLDEVFINYPVAGRYQ